LRDLIFLKNKSWFRFGLAILYRIADLPFHHMQVTTMKKTKGDPSKDYHLLFYQRPIPAVVACARAYMSSLSKSEHDLTFQKNKI
jgi:hypothetical protein